MEARRAYRKIKRLSHQALKALIWFILGLLVAPLVASAVTIKETNHYPQPSETFGYALEARGILSASDTSDFDLSLIAAASYESTAVFARIGLEGPSEVQKGSVSDVQTMVEAEFGVGHVMVEIARAESQFVETAANPKSTARGVFQILVGTFNDPYYGCTGDRHKAKDNIECARKIYEKSGTTPWASSQSSWGYN